MNNYEYIISSLRALAPDFRSGGEDAFASVAQWVRGQCSQADNALIDTLLEGFDGQSLGEGFYRGALRSGNRFIREYFAYDLRLRNAKAAFINKALGRPAGQDIFTPTPEGEEEFSAALSAPDALEREKALDRLLWNKAEAINTFEYFSIDAILGYLARLRLASRWARLDPERGKELFHRLLGDLRASGPEIRYDEK